MNVEANTAIDGARGALEPGAEASAVASPAAEDPRAPLTGRAPVPSVKRFNRRMVAVMAVSVAAVAAFAAGRALTRKPPTRTAPDAAAQATAANPTTSDTINSLPNTYAHRLGSPIPGDLGAMAVGRMGGAGVSPSWTMPASNVPRTAETDANKRALRARESGFGFGGGGHTAPSAGEGAAAVRAPSPGLSMPAGLWPKSGAPGGGRDDDNRQDDKTAFVESDRDRRWALKTHIERPRSPYLLFSGTVIPGVLITGINSDLPGQIEGQVSENVYDTVAGRYLLLPQGTKLLGSYDSRITYGQSRVLIVWTRLIRPDGSSLDLEGMPGVDLSGYAGLTGDIDRHLGRLLTAVVLGSLIQAGTSAGTSYTNPTFADRARQGTGQGVNEATQQLVRKELQLQPTIEVRPGDRFNVFTTRDIVIPPFAG